LSLKQKPLISYQLST